MKPSIPLPRLLAVLGLAGLAGCASSPTGDRAGGGTATVRFTEPGKYADLQRSGASVAESREVLLPVIERFIHEEAARSLRPGHQLNIEFLDIDQAGWIPPASIQRLRVINDRYPARLVFQYELRDASGALLASGRETLSRFASNSVASAQGPDELATEKGLLRAWIRRLGRT